MKDILFIFEISSIFLNYQLAPFEKLKRVDSMDEVFIF